MSQAEVQQESWRLSALPSLLHSCHPLYLDRPCSLHSLRLFSPEQSCLACPVLEIRMRAVHVQCFPMARSASSPVGVAQPREYAVLPWWMLPLSLGRKSQDLALHISHISWEQALVSSGPLRKAGLLPWSHCLPLGSECGGRREAGVLSGHCESWKARAGLSRQGITCSHPWSSFPGIHLLQNSPVGAA